MSTKTPTTTVKMKKTTMMAEYFAHQTELERKYGPRSVVLYEVGNFFEVYEERVCACVDGGSAPSGGGRRRSFGDHDGRLCAKCKCVVVVAAAAAGSAGAVTEAATGPRGKASTIQHVWNTHMPDKGARWRMVGFPSDNPGAFNRHIRALMERGWHAAVYRQYDTPRDDGRLATKQEKTRRLVKIYSRGTHDDDQNMAPGGGGGGGGGAAAGPAAPAVVMAIFVRRTEGLAPGDEPMFEVGVATLSILTQGVACGETYTTEEDPNLPFSRLRELFCAVRPREIVVSTDGMPPNDAVRCLRARGVVFPVECIARRAAPGVLRADSREALFDRVFRVEDATGERGLRATDRIGLGRRESAAVALADLVQFVRDHDTGLADRLPPPKPLLGTDHLVLHTTTLRQLDVVRCDGGGGGGEHDRGVASLLDVVDACVTSMGSTLLRTRVCRPSTDAARIRDRLDLAEAVAPHADALREALRRLDPMRRVVARARVDGRLQSRHLVVLSRAVEDALALVDGALGECTRGSSHASAHVSAHLSDGDVALLRRLQRDLRQTFDLDRVPTACATDVEHTSFFRTGHSTRIDAHTGAAASLAGYLRTAAADLVADLVRAGRAEAADRASGSRGPVSSSSRRRGRGGRGTSKKVVGGVGTLTCDLTVAAAAAAGHGGGGGSDVSLVTRGSERRRYHYVLSTAARKALTARDAWERRRRTSTTAAGTPAHGRLGMREADATTATTTTSLCPTVGRALVDCAPGSYPDGAERPATWSDPRTATTYGGRTYVAFQWQEHVASALAVVHDELRAECDREFDRFRVHLSTTYGPMLHRFQRLVSTIDVAVSTATVARNYAYTRPTIVSEEEEEGADHGSATSSSEGEGPTCKLTGLRHPIIERLSSGRTGYVRNDLEFAPDSLGYVVHGVNAAGKSSLMKSVGLAVIMAQAGLFVPASEMVLRPYEHLFTRITKEDDIFHGQSSFQVEIAELGNIVRRCTGRSLVIGDELCSGTETTSAVAIVAAAITHMVARRTHFLFATHLHEMGKIREVADEPRVHCVHMRVDLDPASGRIVYKRALAPGRGPDVYGVEACADLMPRAFVATARRYRAQLGVGDDGSLRWSAYNMGVALGGTCAYPGCTRCAADVHHLEHQATSNEDGFLPDGRSKNARSNLMCLCKVHHAYVHRTGAAAVAAEWVDTSHGPIIELIDKPM